MDNFLLEEVQYWLHERVEAVAFEVVEQGDAELLLILRLDDAQVGTDGLALCGLEVVEEVRLDRGGIRNLFLHKISSRRDGLSPEIGGKNGGA